MAAFEDRRGPDLDQFTGRKWTDWLNAIQSADTKQQSSTEGTSKRDVEVARLRKADLGLFGHRPATDKFFLAVCEHCGQLVKPQSLNSHYERKHKGKRILRMPAPSGRSRPAHGLARHLPKMNHCTASSEVVQKQQSSRGITNSQGKGTLHMPRHQNAANRPKASMKSDMSATKEIRSGKNFAEPGPTIHRPEKSGTKLIPPQPAKAHSSGHDGVAPSGTRSHKVPGNMHGKVGGKTIKMTDIPDSEIAKPGHQGLDTKHHHRHYQKTLKNEQPSRQASTDMSRHNERRLSDKCNSEVMLPDGISKRAYHTHHHHHLSSQESSLVGGNTCSNLSDTKTSSREQRSSFKDIPVPRVILEKAQVANSNSSGTIKIANQAQKRSHEASGGTESSSPCSKLQVLHSPNGDQPSAADQVIVSHVPNSVLPVKPKKRDRRNIPLKAREYDPNRHCGVWLAEENNRCRRSLTCKVHPLSAKRSVPGRRKPFDELVQEHGREKQRLREKNLSAAAGALAASPTNEVLKPPPKPPEFVVPATASVRSKSVPSTTTVTTTASLASPTAAIATKAKASLNLFPKNFVPWRVDCWDDVDDFTEDLPKAQHSCVFIHRHPQPVAVSGFSAKRFGSCQISFNRRLERQLDSLTSNIQKCDKQKAQKMLRPSCFTPISSATVQEFPSRMVAALPQGNISDEAPWKNQVSLPRGGSWQQGSSQRNRVQLADLSKVPTRPNQLPKTGRTNVVRKSSTPVNSERRAGSDSRSQHPPAEIRNRSKSEQITSLLRRTVNSSSELKLAGSSQAIWPPSDELHPVTTSNYLALETINVNNSSPLMVSSPLSIVSTPVSDASDSVYIASGLKEEQMGSKRTNEKRKNSLNRSPKPSTHKASSKSAISKYVVQQNLLNSYPSEQRDTIPVQLPNGLNSGNILLKPGNSVTLSGNIGALSVTSEDPDSMYTFAGSHQLSKRVKSLNTNNTLMVQKQDTSLPAQTAMNTEHVPQAQRNVVHQEVSSALPENFVLHQDDRIVLGQHYEQDGINHYPNANYIEPSGSSQQLLSQTNQSTDVFSLLQEPIEQGGNYRDLNTNLTKHNIALNAPEQLDQALLEKVTENPPLHRQYVLGSDRTSYNLLQAASLDLTSCSSSANANRTSDISKNFITQ